MKAVSAAVLVVACAVAAAGPTPGECSRAQPEVCGRGHLPPPPSPSSRAPRVSGRAHGRRALARLRPRGLPGPGGGGEVRPAPSRGGQAAPGVRKANWEWAQSTSVLSSQNDSGQNRQGQRRVRDGEGVGGLGQTRGQQVSPASPASGLGLVLCVWCRYIMDDVMRQWGHYDANEDGYVTWEEFRIATFGEHPGPL